MAIDEVIKIRIAKLIEQGSHLSVGNAYGQCVDPKQQQECSAWITAAQNAVHLICESPKTPYRQKVDRIASALHGFCIHEGVGELAEVLKSLMSDADAGLLVSVADKARAELYDDFLDHGEAYYKESRKNESGIIAGVVFEDTLRRICRKQGIPEKGSNLDALISELSRLGELSGVKAKRARVAAHVRTKASHAQWDEFALEDVKATIDFTRELIAAKLDI